jgi:hypothetical protein
MSSDPIRPTDEEKQSAEKSVSVSWTSNGNSSLSLTSKGVKWREMLKKKHFVGLLMTLISSLTLLFLR